MNLTKITFIEFSVIRLNNFKIAENKNIIVLLKLIILLPNLLLLGLLRPRRAHHIPPPRGYSPDLTMLYQQQKLHSDNGYEEVHGLQ